MISKTTVREKHFSANFANEHNLCVGKEILKEAQLFVRVKNVSEKLGEGIYIEQR